jgi:hypothetical protein
MEVCCREIVARDDQVRCGRGDGSPEGAQGGKSPIAMDAGNGRDLGHGVTARAQHLYLAV